jgi:uncharacterized protein (DUF1501 family)
MCEHDHKIKRRSFLKTSSLLTLPLFAGGVPVSAFAKSSLAPMINGEDDRVLVVIQMEGGNDGLATIVPIDQQDNLAAVRSNILIPENQLLNITDTLSLHPSMQGVREIFDNAQLNIIQGVAYPNQNRSHFRSQDVWHTGSAADEYLDTGWLGRYLDSTVTGYPEAFPSDECPDPFALTVGSSVSETCQGLSGSYSMVVLDPEDISTLPTPTNNELANGCYANKLDFLTQTIEQSNVYGEAIKAAYDNGQNLSTKYDDNNNLATKLKTVARLIKGGLQTRIYVVSIGGFDTHAEQIVEGAPTTGNHASLLQELSDAICAFQNDLSLLELDRRVLGMTYSEFGRRIRSNFSFGTDHGTAAPMMVFGHCVNGGVIGDNPEIDTAVDVNEGVAMQYDFKSVYGSILMDWFDVEKAQVQSLFSNDFQYLPILSNCAASSIEEINETTYDLKALPNPMSDYLNVSFNLKSKEDIRLSLFDVLGAEIKVISNRAVAKGLHEVKVELHDVVPGPYFLRLQTRTGQKTLRLVKVK